MRGNKYSPTQMMQDVLDHAFRGHFEDYRCYILLLSESDELRIQYAYGFDEDVKNKGLWSNDKQIALACMDNDVISYDIPDDHIPEWISKEDIDEEYVDWLLSSNMKSAIFYPWHYAGGGLAMVFVVESPHSESQSGFDNARFQGVLGAGTYQIGSRLAEFQENKLENPKSSRC